jgi:alkylated DNA repair dioxygenase AlkB
MSNCGVLCQRATPIGTTFCDVFFGMLFIIIMIVHELANDHVLLPELTLRSSAHIVGTTHCVGQPSVVFVSYHHSMSSASTEANLRKRKLDEDVQNPHTVHTSKRAITNSMQQKTLDMCGHRFASNGQSELTTAAKDAGAFKTHHLSDTSYYVYGQVPDHVRFHSQEMLRLKPDMQDTVIMRGKPVLTPRYVAHYLRSYYYTGRLHEAQPLPDILRPLFDWTNAVLLPAINMSGEFNQVLVNYYMNGSHYIGKHSDDEKQMVRKSPIFSASFGQERMIRLRDKSNGSIVKDIPLQDGAFVLMCGDMQKEYTHEIVKVLGKKGNSMSARMNVTERMFVMGAATHNTDQVNLLDMMAIKSNP